MANRETCRAVPVEIREAEGGPHLYGTLIQEGRAARRRREIFVPGSVSWPVDGVGVLTRHHGEPAVRAIPERQSDGRITLRAKATVAICQAVAAGHRYMSVEFHAIRERVTEGGIREIQRAFVPDVALVTEPEYDMTRAEVRQRAGGFRTAIKPKKRIDCKCAEGDASAVEFTVDAFSDVASLDVTAISRGAESVIASTATGSLSLEAIAGGGLAVSLATLDTEAGRRTRELLDAGVDVYARPVWMTGESVFEVRDGVAYVSRASFSYLLVRPVPEPDARGLDPLVPGGEGRAGIPWERRRLLL